MMDLPDVPKLIDPDIRAVFIYWEFFLMRRDRAARRYVSYETCIEMRAVYAPAFISPSHRELAT